MSFYVYTHLPKKIGVCVSILYIKIVIYITPVFIFYKEFVHIYIYIHITTIYFHFLRELEFIFIVKDISENRLKIV